MTEMVPMHITPMQKMSRVSFNLPSKDELMLIEGLAEQACKMGHYERLMKGGGKAAILLLLLTAREYDIPPMQALNGGLMNIDGKIEMATHLMCAKIRQSGHSIEVQYGQDEKLGAFCKLSGKRKDNGDTMTITYGMAHAQQAGLSTRDSWKKYPREMCYARALGRLARMLFADVLGGIYTIGEISDSEPLGETVTAVPVKQVEINVGKLQEFNDFWLKKFDGSFEEAEKARIADPASFCQEFAEYCEKEPNHGMQE
jgi:hypothetical protein